MSEEKQIVVDTSLGKICGKVSEVKAGSRVAHFLGVPYAKQPLGRLRFQPLEALDAKLDCDESPFMATKCGSSALQAKVSFFASQLPTSEACIYLNIFVPMHPETVRQSGDLSLQKRPVFFHIHGGAFIRGSGSEPYYDMTHFVARHNAVAVSINYRLGVLGFLSCPPAIEHNLGLKDQQFALKWVYENISSFGGDPDNITIFGCSAGAASVHYHMMTPSVHKYFCRGIGSSGTYNKLWCKTSLARQREKLRTTLKMLGCAVDATPEQTRDFLVSLPAEKFDWFFSGGSKKLENEFVPVADEDHARPLADLVVKKPYIVGVTAEEGKLFPDFLFPRENNTSPTWARDVIGDFVTEKYFFSPLKDLLRQFSDIPDFPLYAYLFDYDCQSRSEILPERVLPRHFGKFHSCDVPFVLSAVRAESQVLTPTGNDDRVSEIWDNIIDCFIRDENFEMPLAKYEATGKIVNRITGSGLQQEPEEKVLRISRGLLELKTLAAAGFLTASPTSF